MQPDKLSTTEGFQKKIFWRQEQLLIQSHQLETRKICVLQYPKIDADKFFHTLHTNSQSPYFLTMSFLAHHSLIHSLTLQSLPYDRSIASSKPTSPHSAIQCFLFHFPISSLFLKASQELLTSSSSPFHHFQPYLYHAFDNMSQKAVPTLDVTNQVTLPFLTVCRMFLLLDSTTMENITYV